MYYNITIVVTNKISNGKEHKDSVQKTEYVVYLNDKTYHLVAMFIKAICLDNRVNCIVKHNTKDITKVQVYNSTSFVEEIKKSLVYVLNDSTAAFIF